MNATSWWADGGHGPFLVGAYLVGALMFALEAALLVRRLRRAHRDARLPVCDDDEG